jgi:hypothetical protein
MLIGGTNEPAKPTGERGITCTVVVVNRAVVANKRRNKRTETTICEHCRNRKHRREIKPSSKPTREVKGAIIESSTIIISHQTRATPRHHNITQMIPIKMGTLN